MKLKNNRRFNGDPTSAAMIPPFLRAAALSAALAIALALPSLAQSDDPNNAPPMSAGEGADPNATAPSGPVRMARFSYIEGEVTWRGGDEGIWSAGAQNFPLRQGAQLWVGDNSRAEIQFDDGSRLRLDANTLVTLQTLYSDTQGEFTEITLNDGQLMLRLKNQFSQYQVNTAVASLKAIGPSRVRVGSGQGAQFAVTQGEATIEGGSGSATLGEGGYLDVVQASSPFRVRSMPAEDGWDQWNDDRDNALDAPSNTAKYCPANIALVADNLDSSGDWRNDPRYGHVWCPRDMPVDWRPYSNGQWTWVEPFGWTWVGSESWGWAPYHYGAWVPTGYGWAWVPGPAVQYWSPATVSFYQSNGTVAWCPLAPSEVRYPRAMGIGFRGGNWSAFFSIGGAACYYPAEGGDGNYCVARPFSNNYVNRVTYVNVNHVTNVYNTTVVRNVTINNSTFVPSNARHSGGTQVSVNEFGGHAAYRPVHGNGGNFFARGGGGAGGLVTGPSGHGASAFGPPNVPITRLSLTPTHSYTPHVRLPEESTARPIFRAPLPNRIPAAAISAGPRFGRPGGSDGRPSGDGRPDGGIEHSGAHESPFAHANHGNTGSRPATTTMPVTRPEPATASGATNKPVGSPQGNPRFGEGNTGTGNNGGVGRPVNPASGSAHSGAFGGQSSGRQSNSVTAAAAPTAAATPRSGNAGGNPNHGAFGNRNPSTAPASPASNATAPPAPARTLPGGGSTGASNSAGGRNAAQNAAPPIGSSGTGSHPASGWGQRNSPSGGGANGSPANSGGPAATPAGPAAPAPTYRTPHNTLPGQAKPDKTKKPVPSPSPPAANPVNPATPAKP